LLRRRRCARLPTLRVLLRGVCSWRRYASAMREQDIFWIVIGGIALLTGIVLVVSKRRASTLNEMLARLTASFGWEAVRRTWWNGALRGTWRGFPVALQHMNRYKGIPERVQLTLQTQVPGRLIVKRRTGGFL